jgi:hypothetical protein
MTQQEQLARLKNYRTRYECTMTDGNQTFLLAYSPGRSRQDMLNIARKHGQRIVDITKSENITFAKKVAEGAMCGDWKIRFTGRTQRDCILEGEKPFIEEN